MELIEIVDKDGNFTGEIMEKEKAHDKNLLHNEIGVFVLNDKKQVLLQKRSSIKRFDSNKWGLCAGHVDAGESLEDAALREIKEELGIDVSLNDLYSFAEREFTIKSFNSHITYFFYIKCDKKEDEFIIQEEELSEVRWFDIDEIISMIKCHDVNITFNEDRIKLFDALKII